MLNQRLRKLSWDDYDISRHRYGELKEFCLQYHEKKAKVNRGLAAVSYAGMPVSNYKENALEKKAIKNVVYDADCKIIEKAAQLAAGDLAEYILKSVTNDLSYEFIEYDEKLGRIPVGRTDFYAIRRYFYHQLDILKSGTK